jgi:hypothetical protein
MRLDELLIVAGRIEMKKAVYVTSVLVLMNMLASCASVMGAKKEVDLNSTPSKATATITDSKNQIVDTIVTPGKITLPKAGKYTVTFSMPDYISKEALIYSIENSPTMLAQSVLL